MTKFFFSDMKYAPELQTSLQSSCDEEEADTKFLLHARDFLKNSTDAVVLVRSPSGDIEIINMFQAESEGI